MKKIFVILVLITSCSLFAQQAEISSISSMPGAFSRMGFGARGMGMGNAMSSVTEGNVVSYYNPALSVFQQNNSVQASYSFLSLDRKLNFLNFTRKFELRSKRDSSGAEPRGIAGISIGIINSGVSNIDGRDNQGLKTGELSTSENQFFLSFANRFSKKLALGLAVKFYYYKLYEKMTTNGLGFDLGAIYSVNDNIHLSIMLSDLNSKYKWDSKDVRGEQGKTTEDKFPLLKKFGISYRFDDPRLIASLEFENSNAETNIVRFGAEYNIYDGLFLRGGLDKWNLSNKDFPPRPSLGFSFFKNYSNSVIGFDYAFVVEPYSSSNQHILGLNFNF
ncbi:MAG: hypothetical protein ACM3MI_02115 [Clostridiales bacterium]